jgi:tripartite ATP-independent transporter DctP family solute receptor
VASGVVAPVRAEPEFKLKFASSMPVNHPLNTRMVEAGKQISEQTRGQVEIQVLPMSDLGTGAHMLSALSNGTWNLVAQTGLTIQTLVPSASITAVGFAFANYEQVWSAVDGRLGSHIIENFRKAELIAFEKMWDNGFRQTTSFSKPIKTPNDFTDVKIRAPSMALWTSLFESLGAVPASIPWDETHSALQRKVVDGLDSTRAGIYFGRMYEVQKYVSRTGHIWDGFWLLADQRSFEAMPAQHRSVITSNINEAAMKQRADVKQLEAELQAELTAKGMQFNEVKH